MADDPLTQLVERLQGLCVERGVWLATAESCTGGLVAHLITGVPGSSGYFRGGIVSYSDDAKRLLLDVGEELLAAHGAVSAQVARAMAIGVRGRLGVDMAISVTGVAGPGGGSVAKPVGLTYIAVADDRGVDVRRFVWGADRAANNEASARAAIELLLARLEAAGPGSAE
jgi:PncC family amidohydrolase